MPRKQNGFVVFEFCFKGINSNVKSGKVLCIRQIPSERKFGSTVQRSVIEQYNVHLG